MGEAAVGIAGLALAVPGVIDLGVKYGEWIVDRVRTFKKARKVLEDLATFGQDLANGRLISQIAIARKIYAEEGYDEALKKTLEDQIARLGEELKTAVKFLQAQDVEHPLGRGLFALRGERKTKAIYADLRRHQKDLSESLILEDLKKRIVPDQLKLDQKRLRHDTGKGYVPVPFTKNLFNAWAEFKDTEDAMLKEFHILVETRETLQAVPEDTVKEIAVLLYYRLSKGYTTSGRLPCLGYRMEPEPALIFEVPKDYHNPQTLQTIIAADIGKSPKHPLDHRLKLGRELSEAVLSVHAAGLVHKNLRTESILIFQVPDDANQTNETGFGKLFLSQWEHLRTVDQLSARMGDNEWTRNMYRHPKRQGLEVQERYNIGHDIYSLGVCLLEIGLWDPLVQTRTVDGKPKPSDLFRAAANTDTQSDPEKALAALMKKPDEVREVLLKLCQREIPQRLGLRYEKLVVQCLKCLDSPSAFGEDVDFRKFSEIENGLAFKELVLGAFTDISF
jgi:hypothetical protein